MPPYHAVMIFVGAVGVNSHAAAAVTNVGITQ
jgi:hypothetical protein